MFTFNGFYDDDFILMSRTVEWKFVEWKVVEWKLVEWKVDHTLNQ